jgi:hypothetical protein
MRKLFVLSIIFLFAVNVFYIHAEEPVPPEPEQQEQSPRSMPRFRGRAVLLDINARIIEQDQQVTWNEKHRKTTFPGQPVGLKLVGTNVVVAVQLTPYIRRSTRHLVAQAQIWMDIPNQGIRYQNSMQTIPLEFGEAIYFFPLGSSRNDNTEYIEIMLTLNPHEEDN